MEYTFKNDLFYDKMNKYQIIFERDNFIKNMIVISENIENDIRLDVIEKIKNDIFEKQNAIAFFNSMNKSKHKKMLTPYSPDELSNMKLFKLKGYDIGYALKKWNDGSYSEIVAVYNNEKNIKGIGEELMKSAIRNGGRHLDHFDGFLTDFYSKLGFKEYKRDKYDPKYDENGEFKSKYGEQDVIYRTLL